MTVVKIRYAELEQVAAKATNVAGAMNDYADDLPKKINNPLDSLEGGDSNYTSTTAQLALTKAKQLKDRATSYNNFSNQVTTFVSDARDADRSVKQNFNAITDRLTEGMSLWERFCHAMYSVYCQTIGSTELGAFLGNLLSNAGAALNNAFRDVYNWFTYGDGQYVLNIVVAGLAAAAAIIGAILCFPVSGVLAAIVAVASIVAAVVAVYDFVATAVDNSAAILEDDPGVARYLGSTESVTDFAYKHTDNQFIRDAATLFNITGDVAGLVSFVGGGFTTRGADGFVTAKFSWDDVIGGRMGLDDVANCIMEPFGFKPSSTNPGNYRFDPAGMFGFGNERSVITNPANAWVNTVETIRDVVEPINSITSISQTAFEGIHGRIDSVTDVTGALSDAIPGLEFIDRIATSTEDLAHNIVERFR